MNDNVKPSEACLKVNGYISMFFYHFHKGKQFSRLLVCIPE